MTQASLLLLIAGSLFLLCLAVALPMVLRPSAEEQRLQQIIATSRPVPQAGRRERLEASLLRISVAIRGRLGLQLGPETKRRLEMAGYRTAASHEVYFALCWLLPLLGAYLGSFMPQNTIFCALLFVAVGYLLPGMVLSAYVTRYRNRIRRALPDAIDLLVICVDAGLGLDQALQRVGREIALGAPVLHKELSRLSAEQRAGRSRTESWEEFTDRVPLDELKTFTSMLIQAERFGTPLSKSLSRFADDLRLKRRQRAEEAAAKAKVKIIFPLVFFIFPALFIVLLTPALLSVFQELGSATR